MKIDKALFDQWMHSQFTPGSGNNVYDALYVTKGQQTIGHELYAAKSISAVASFDDLFKSDDTLSVGLTNVATAQLPANTYFLLTGVSLQYAVAGGTTAQYIKDADYTTPLPAVIVNGEISISLNKKPIMDKRPCSIFTNGNSYVATGDTNATAGTAVTYTMALRGQCGYYELESPKMLTPQELIEVKLKFTAAAASNAALKVIFHGVTNVTA